MPRLSLCTLALPALALAASAAAPPADVDRLRCPKPTSFAFVFSNGYASDNLPRDDGQFEKMLVAIKKGHFDVVHCAYTDQRLALCRKHGVKMMVDLLMPEHHVYKNPDGAKKLCQRLRGDEAVWGYDVWNDKYAKTGPGRRRDVHNVRLWDPTHPAYTGTYRTEGMRHVSNADVFGYYDFHWKRGIDQHFGHLMAFHTQAKATDSSFLSLLSATSGLAGKGNYNRNVYSANTLLACGGKGLMWFIASDLMDFGTMEWKPAGGDIVKVQQKVRPIASQLARLGQPEAVYTTKVTKTPNGADVKERMPPGLDRNAVPKDYWLQVTRGECLLGVFRDGERRVVCLVNHNAYADAPVKVEAKGMKAERFDREKGAWRPAGEGEVAVTLGPGEGELLRFGR